MLAPPTPLTFERHIEAKLLAHFAKLGLSGTEQGTQPADRCKDQVRALHSAQRSDLIRRNTGFIEAQWAELRRYFASGANVDPRRIEPRLEMVAAESRQSRLFRLASLLWSIPVSQGYGRRMRFLVWDEQNGKLIGLIALGDPVFNLRVRDAAVGWNVEDRRERLVHTMDAYVLGAVPPYNRLLGGKMVAAMLRTAEIRDVFSRKYGNRAGVISGRSKQASLVLITTSSALGRSSVYNRVALKGRHYLEACGYSAGWGHFHIPDEIWTLIRGFLSARDHEYCGNHRFGDGPNWKMRAVRQSLTMLGMDPSLLRHGVKRQVFLCRLAENANAVLRGTEESPDYSGLLSAEEVGPAAVERWMKPRALRDPSFRDWTAEDTYRLLVSEQPEEGKTRVAGQLRSG